MLMLLFVGNPNKIRSAHCAPKKRNTHMNLVNKAAALLRNLRAYWNVPPKGLHEL